MSICEAAQALNEPSRKGRIANRIRNARKPFDPPRSGIIGRPPPKRGLTVVNRCERIVERRVAERSAIGCRTCSFTETNNALQAFGLFTGDDTGAVYPVTVSRIAGSVDPVSQSVKVTGELQLPKREKTAGDAGAAALPLLPGMSGRVAWSPAP